MNSKKILAGLYLVFAGVYVARMFTISEYPIATWEVAMGISFVVLGMMKLSVEEMKAIKMYEDLEEKRTEVKEMEDSLKMKTVFMEEVVSKMKKTEEVEEKMN